jgi:hypothetical protein
MWRRGLTEKNSVLTGVAMQAINKSALAELWSTQRTTSQRQGRNLSTNTMGLRQKQKVNNDDRKAEYYATEPRRAE